MKDKHWLLLALILVLFFGFFNGVFNYREGQIDALRGHQNYKMEITYQLVTELDPLYETDTIVWPYCGLADRVYTQSEHENCAITHLPCSDLAIKTCIYRWVTKQIYVPIDTNYVKK